MEVDPAFARRLAASAGLRNRIAHEYDEIDPHKVHEAIPATVEDVPAYLRSVDAFVRRATGTPR